MSREADATALLAEGDIAFWNDGDAIAICYGPTPISGPGEMRLASPGNVWARAVGDPRMLAAARGGEAVRVEAI